MGTLKKIAKNRSTFFFRSATKMNWIFSIYFVKYLQHVSRPNPNKKAICIKHRETDQTASSRVLLCVTYISSMSILYRNSLKNKALHNTVLALIGTFGTLFDG